MITFEYNGKIYKPSNLENKLKKLGITINDVKIIDDTETKAEKDKKEQDNKPNIYDPYISVYWDTKTAGWYLIRETELVIGGKINKDGMTNYLNNIWTNERYICVDKCKESQLSECYKKHFKNLMGAKDRTSFLQKHPEYLI